MVAVVALVSHYFNPNHDVSSLMPKQVIYTRYVYYCSHSTTEVWHMITAYGAYKEAQ